MGTIVEGSMELERLSYEKCALNSDEILNAVQRKRSMQPQSDLRNIGNDVYSTDEVSNKMLDLPITTKATIHRSVGNGNKMLI